MGNTSEVAVVGVGEAHGYKGVAEKIFGGCVIDLFCILIVVIVTQNCTCVEIHPQRGQF